MNRAYYNEIDPYAAQWLRNLIDAGHIARGDVDERSIADVRPADLRGYTQCHFFAGIGGWSIALRLAGWPDDRPVWTGSCPCQPFSAAGAGKAADDERHLWPAWFPLIAELRPTTVFGEQVEAAVGWGWLDAVFADLEGEGYACGAAVLPACGVGAPHIRQRLWFVAHATESRRQAARQHDGGQPLVPARHAEHGGTSDLADAQRGTAERRRHDMAEMPGRSQSEARQRQRIRDDNGSGGELSPMADPNGRNPGPERLQRGGKHGQRAQGGGACELADTKHAERRPECQIDGQAHGRYGHGRRGNAGELGNPDSEREIPLGRICEGASAEHDGTGALVGFWSDAEWIACTDGKARPVKPGTFPLVHGVSFRVGSGGPFAGKSRSKMLHGAGNAIVPELAAEFIAAASEVKP